MVNKIVFGLFRYNFIQNSIHKVYQFCFKKLLFDRGTHQERVHVFNQKLLKLQLIFDCILLMAS